jgi:hypothetical protein
LENSKKQIVSNCYKIKKGHSAKTAFFSPPADLLEIRILYRQEWRGT